MDRNCSSNDLHEINRRTENMKKCKFVGFKKPPHAINNNAQMSFSWIDSVESNNWDSIASNILNAIEFLSDVFCSALDHILRYERNKHQISFVQANSSEKKQQQQNETNQRNQLNSTIKAFLPSSRRNLLPARCKIKTEHMPSHRRIFYNVQNTTKKNTHKIPRKFHFLMLLLLFSVWWLLMPLLLALYTQFDRHLLEGIEYFSEPIRTLHSTAVCICGIVYLRL